MPFFNHRRFSPHCWAAMLMAVVALMGCGAPGPGLLADGASPTHVTLPLESAWHDGQLVRYISTDTSDAGMARAKGMNFVPRLAMAVPQGPAAPGRRSALERVYMFTDASQHNVFPSVPHPVGPSSTDAAYSPLWQVHTVAWQAGRTRRELRSEEQVLAAAEQGDVVVTATGIVTNCAVVQSASGGLLPGAALSRHLPGG